MPPKANTRKQRASPVGQKRKTYKPAPVGHGAEVAALTDGLVARLLELFPTTEVPTSCLGIESFSSTVQESENDLASMSVDSSFQQPIALAPASQTSSAEAASGSSPMKLFDEDLSDDEDDEDCDGRSVTEIASLINLVYPGGPIVWNARPLALKLVCIVAGFGYSASEILRIDLIADRVASEFSAELAFPTVHLLNSVTINIVLK